MVSKHKLNVTATNEAITFSINGTPYGMTFSNNLGGKVEFEPCFDENNNVIGDRLLCFLGGSIAPPYELVADGATIFSEGVYEILSFNGNTVTANAQLYDYLKTYLNKAI